MKTTSIVILIACGLALGGCVPSTPIYYPPSIKPDPSYIKPGFTENPSGEPMTVGSGPDPEMVQREILGNCPPYLAEAQAGRIMLGMTAVCVRRVLGSPHDINRSVSMNGIREQWVFRYPTRYLYFEDGILVSWQD
jgi:hypothetical protein